VNLGLEGDAGHGRDVRRTASRTDRLAVAGRADRGRRGRRLGALHAWLCARPRVNDVAVGIALMLFGVGLAFFLGKPLIGPSAPAPAGGLGRAGGSASDQVRSGAADQRAVRDRAGDDVAVRFAAACGRAGA
jgi:ABC-type uncharacterized transport system permease subunit